MKQITLYLLIFLFGIVLISSCSNQPKNNVESEKYLVVLSMDAFRWDYPNKYETPNLDSIAKYGVKAHSLKPSFPSKTFPNHYTMATGLYPNNHGIVQNSFYDPELDLHYSIENREAVKNPVFYGGEPIWVTAEIQGKKSASYFWVGTETKIKGIQPSIWKDYDHHFPYENRIDSVIKWLQLPMAERPKLIMWYMNEPDDVGHYEGPESKETAATIKHLDSLVGVFIKKINQLPNADQIDLIFTADHGMGSISEDRYVFLGDYLPKEWFNHVKGYNPVFLLDAKKEKEDSTFAILSKIPHIQGWRSKDVPKRLNYGSNPRTLDFVVAADSSWSVDWENRGKKGKGTHGYDNDNKDMHAIFYAIGPSFKSNYNQPTFNNVDLYNLFAHLLDLEPAPNDGNFDNVKGMLK